MEGKTAKKTVLLDEATLASFREFVTGAEGIEVDEENALVLANMFKLAEERLAAGDPLEIELSFPMKALENLDVPVPDEFN